MLENELLIDRMPNCVCFLFNKAEYNRQSANWMSHELAFTMLSRSSILLLGSIRFIIVMVILLDAILYMLGIIMQLA